MRAILSVLVALSVAGARSERAAARSPISRRSSDRASK